MSVESQPETVGPKWRILERVERRVLGVLIEKAKTTPDGYPMSLNALVNGCNQKSNRFPQMQLDETAVESALEKLRQAGAVALIQGDGRVDKHRHLAYDWLGTNKQELAVMAELLLRGAQSMGDLRARAARMEPIPGINELRPIIESLRQKKLIVLLTPPGRGCVLTHNLYQPQELDKVRAEHGNVVVGDGPWLEEEDQAVATVATRPAAAPAHLERPQLALLEEAIQAIRADLSSEIDKLREELDDLKRQLGV